MVAKKLVETFPAIENLVLFDCLLNEKEILELLTSWCTTLTSLKLVIDEQNFNWSLIISVLKRMPRLEHLSLFSSFGFPNRPVLPFLCQLKSFQFAFYRHNGSDRQCWLSDLIGQLNPAVLQKVDIGVFTSQTYKSYFFRYNLKQLIIRHPAVATKLRRLQFPAISPTFFHFLASQFTSVSWLNIELTSINDLKQISGLRKLQFLGLRRNQRPYSDCPLNRVLNRRDKQTMAAIKPMVAVTNLLLLDFNIDENLLRKLFPNVKKIERHCRGDKNNVDYDD